MSTTCALPIKQKRFTTSYLGTLTSVLLGACILILPASAEIVHSAQVTLAWHANTESDLAGYIVYSKMVSAPAKDSYNRRIIICDPGADPPCDAVLSTPGSPQYEIDNVSDSDVTYIAISAFDSSGNESRLSNALSYNPDTDDDGMADWWELQFFDNLDRDGTMNWDDDGLIDLAEFEHDTDPIDPDSDGDGFSDGHEVGAGTDPNDPTSHPSRVMSGALLLLLSE